MTFTTTTYASAIAEQHRQRHARRRFFIAAALAAAFILAVGCAGCAGGATGSGPADPNPPAVVVQGTAQPAESKPAGVGDGQHAVGVDIKPGTYVTTVPAGGLGCYWARVKDFSGELNSIIANGNIPVDGRGRVDVKASDKGVEFMGGCTWKRVSK